MTVRIKVWGDFDAQNRTPLLAEEAVEVADYGQAREVVTSAIRRYGGRSGHGECDGPNQNYNSIWKSGTH